MLKWTFWISQHWSQILANNHQLNISHFCSQIVPKKDLLIPIKSPPKRGGIFLKNPFVLILSYLYIINFWYYLLETRKHTNIPTALNDKAKCIEIIIYALRFQKKHRWLSLNFNFTKEIIYCFIVYDSKITIFIIWQH